MKTIKVDEANSKPNPHEVDVRKLYDTEHGQAMHITLEPGESLKQHITPVDVIFYVLEGTGICEIGEEQEEVGPDTLVDSPARIPHCWHNKGDETLRVLVVKLPRPTEKTQLL